MEDKQKIKDFKKIQELKKHNHSYFNKDKPNISDADYDRLKKVINLESANDFLKELKLLEN